MARSRTARARGNWERPLTVPGGAACAEQEAGEQAQGPRHSHGHGLERVLRPVMIDGTTGALARSKSKNAGFAARARERSAGRRQW